MSNKNFMAYGDAETLFSEVGSELGKRILQMSTIPSASVDYLNMIIQYIGATSETYTNGYFYKCIYDSENSRYIWENIDVQNGGEGGYLGTGTLLASGWSDKQQTLTFVGYKASMNGVIGIPTDATAAQKAAYTDALVDVVSQSGNSFTFKVENVPSIDLPVVLYAGGGSGSGGGTNVEPNPSETATTNLEKIKIDSTTYAVKDTNAIHESDVGVAGGVAELDNNGKVPSAQLPSFVDDVVEGYYDDTTDRFYEESTFETVIPPVDGKLWVDIVANKSYRWTGSVYVRVDEGVQLGETSSSAYRGDRGKTAYDHATESGKISAAVTSGLYKVAATAEGHIASLTAVEKADITALGIPESMPTVNNATLTIQKNGTQVAQFTANSASDVTANISVPTVTDTYSGTSSDGMSGKAVKSAIDALDGTITGSAGAGKTLTAFSQTDGKVSATFSDISITKSQISDFPTIPTVYNSTITIKKNGTTVDSFTLNQSSGKNIDISVPTKTSDLTNDSGFVTTDEKITGETKNPTSDTTYNVLFTNSTTNQKPFINNGIRTYTKEGTASATGYTGISLGNNTSSGTAGNKYGCVRFYSEKNAYTNLLATASSTTDRTIRLPDKNGTIALTADLTTYAFAEGANNGEIKITPSVGGTAGTAVTVKPKGISDLAYIAKGSGSSKFLREDGQWTTVTASWSGGAITSDIYPNATGTLKVGKISRYFSESYVRTAYVNTCVVGYDGEVTGSLYLSRAEGYSASITAPVLSGNVALTLPSASGTLVTDSYLNSKFVTLTRNEVPALGTSGKLLLSKVGRSVTAVFSAVNCYNFVSSTELIPSNYSEYRPNNNTSFIGIVYLSNSSCYIGTIDLITDGKMNIKYYDKISSRASVGNTGHMLYATACWCTNS